MRLTRIHVPGALSPGALVELPASQGQHLTRVLRLERGAPLVAFNGEGGEYEAVIEGVRRSDVTVRIGAHHAMERESPLDITLLQGIARGEKMDLIVQKATELGVTRVVPLTMVRSNVRLDAKTAQRKREHWQGVVDAACEQSGRNRVPEVAEPAALAEALRAAAPGLQMLLTPDADSKSLVELVAAHRTQEGLPPVTLLVGPEGGFDPQETRLAKEAGFCTCRLGARVLRTETAALAALAALQALAGDFA